MPTWLDQLAVGLLVLASMVYAGIALGPKSWRPKLRRGAAKKIAGGCGGCAGCADPAPAGGEVRIAAQDIGRRVDRSDSRNE